MIYSELIPIIQNEDCPTCPFCKKDLCKWTSKEPTFEQQFICSCKFLFIVDSFLLPNSADEIIFDTIRFICDGIEINLNYRLRMSVIQPLDSTHKTLIEELVPFDFSNVEKSMERIKLYNIFS